MSNFTVLKLIDDVLGRLHAVAPSYKVRHKGPTQWLYIAEPKNSYELELVRFATTLSAPVFPPSEKRLPGGNWEMDDGSLQTETPPPKLLTGLPFPVLLEGQVSYSVDWHALQSLSGLRAVLLVLVDSCGLCAATTDFIGIQPWTDSTPVLVEMKKWSQDDFVPNAKYWKDWPLARFLQNPLPPKPQSWTQGTTAPLFKGETGRYFLRLATYSTEREDSFAFYRAVYGIAQSKRGFAAVPSCYVQRSLAKHAAKLSSPPSSTPDLVSAKIFAETFFKGFRMGRVFDQLPSIEGSTNASVENPRAHGGAREYLLQRASEIHTGDELESHGPFMGLDDPRDRLIGFRSKGTSQVFEERGLPPLTPSQWKFLARRSHPSISVDHLDAHTQQSLRALYALQPEARDLPIARVAEILEPLKVRLVTAMDAVRSHVARPVQSSLWRYLRDFPCFRLIGEPITESIVQDLIDADEKWFGLKDPLFQYGTRRDLVSGDYSAATDGLDINVSNVFIQAALDHLQPEEQEFRDFIASILLKQVLVYPPGSGIKPVLQQNGQLMGSVLSFPLLCMANLFSYIMAMPNAQEIIRSVALMKKLPVLINGDDILFRTNDRFYQDWQKSIASVGFVPSVGKNFVHPRFCTVNSVPIQYLPARAPDLASRSWADIEEEDGRPFHVTQVPDITIGGFLNVGLLTGQAKLTGRDSLTALPLSGWHAGSVIAALNPSQAHKWFLHYHREEILRQTRHASQTLNIFAHPLLGGLGFQVPSGVEPRFSPEQRRIARALYLSASYTYEAQEKDYSLKSLVYLESDLESPHTTVAHVSRRVEVELYPIGTPLPEGYVPFTDNSGIAPTAMVQVGLPFGSKAAKLRSVCRLSSTRIRQLTKRFDQTVDLHPVDQMTVFPFSPVRVQRRTFEPSSESRPNDPSTYVERIYSRVYAPSVPFQDIVVPPPPQDPPIPTVTVLEDWESSDITLVLPSVVLPSLRSLRNREGSARRAAEVARNRRNHGLLA